jgi:ribosomal protein S18 acetylase RimI-like enzyme
VVSAASGTGAARALPAGIALRPAGDGDLDVLRRIYGESRDREMALLPHWSADDRDSFLRQQFDAQHRHYHAHYPGARYELILRDGEPVGRLYVCALAEEVRLMDIALLAAQRGRGIGTALVQRVLEEARSAGKPITLHVEADNPARRLYERLGFRVVGSEGVYLRMCRDADASRQTPSPAQLNTAS